MIFGDLYTTMIHCEIGLQRARPWLNCNQPFRRSITYRQTINHFTKWYLPTGGLGMSNPSYNVIPTSLPSDKHGHRIQDLVISIQLGSSTGSITLRRCRHMLKIIKCLSWTKNYITRRHETTNIYTTDHKFWKMLQSVPRHLKKWQFT